MARHMFYIAVLMSLGILLGACSSSEHQDLKEYIKEKKQRPPGKIKEAPKIEPYKSFTYDAYHLRSPFDRPVSVDLKPVETTVSTVDPPDEKRVKQRLEQFDLSSLSMVGTLSKGGIFWALVSDPDGTVERIREGDYLGRNHGKVTALSENKVDLMEIVASGKGWLERPNVLELKQVEEK